MVGDQAGAIIGMSASGLISEQYGWPYVFYIFGTIGVAWSALRFGFVISSPE